MGTAFEGSEMTTVLIVDDDALVREGLRLILGSTEDLTVVGEAENGRIAVHATRRLVPDIVLMDLRMPVLDGIGAIAELTRAELPSQILALTTFDSDEHVIAALNAGAAGYLLKDTPPRDIIHAVRETAAGRTVLSPRHTRVLLNLYSKDEMSRRQQSAARTLSSLSDREREIVAGVSAGLTNAEIGNRLHCSPATVKAHLASIFSRLGVTNRIELAILGHDAALTQRAASSSAAVRHTPRYAGAPSPDARNTPSTLDESR